jgi:hypothetical protein
MAHRRPFKAISVGSRVTHRVPRFRIPPALSH